jgi:hypothetical protein
MLLNNPHCHPDFIEIGSFVLSFSTPTGQRTHPDRLKVKSRVQVGVSVIRPEYIGVANHNLQGVVAQ